MKKQKTKKQQKIKQQANKQYHEQLLFKYIHIHTRDVLRTHSNILDGTYWLLRNNQYNFHKRTAKFWQIRHTKSWNFEIKIEEDGLLRNKQKYLNKNYLYRFIVDDFCSVMKLGTKRMFYF